MKTFKKFITEKKIQFPVVVVINRNPIKILKNSDQLRKAQNKYPESSKDNVEFMNLDYYKRKFATPDELKKLEKV